MDQVRDVLRIGVPSSHEKHSFLAGEGPRGHSGDSLGVSALCEGSEQPRERMRGNERRPPALADDQCPGGRCVRRAVHIIKRAMKGDLHGQDRSLFDAEETFEKYLRSRSATSRFIREQQPSWSEGREHIMHSQCGRRTIVMVLVDSGANTYSIPTTMCADMKMPMCRQAGKGSVTGVGGVSKTSYVRFYTPFGSREGLANSYHPQSLMPESELTRNGYIHKDDSPVAVTCYRGIRTTLRKLAHFTYAAFLYTEGKAVLLNEDEWHLYLEEDSNVLASKDCGRHVEFHNKDISAWGPVPDNKVETNNVNFAKATAAPREVRRNYMLPVAYNKATHICTRTDCREPQCSHFQSCKKNCILRSLTQKEISNHDVPRKVAWSATQDVQLYHPLDTVHSLHCAGDAGWYTQDTKESERQGPLPPVPRKKFFRTKVMKTELPGKANDIPDLPFRDETQEVSPEPENGGATDTNVSATETSNCQNEHDDAIADTTIIPSHILYIRENPERTERGDEKAGKCIAFRCRATRDPNPNNDNNESTNDKPWGLPADADTLSERDLAYLRGEPSEVLDTIRHVLACEADDGTAYVNTGKKKKRKRKAGLCKSTPVNQEGPLFVGQVNFSKSFADATKDEFGEEAAQLGDNLLHGEEKFEKILDEEEIRELIVDGWVDPEICYCSFNNMVSNKQTTVLRAEVSPEHLILHEPFDPNCEHCVTGHGKVKGQRRIMADDLVKFEKAKVPGERIFADLCTPWPRDPFSCNTMLALLDEHEGLPFLDGLIGKTPGGVTEGINRTKALLDDFCTWRKKKVAKSWKLKSDLGAEFVAKSLTTAIAYTGGFHEHVAKGRHISQIENLIGSASPRIRTMLAAAGLPSRYWSFAARTWAHNKRLSNSKWKQFMKFKKEQDATQIFGRMGYCKLADKLQATPKSMQKAAPICYLGPACDARKTSYIMYKVYEGPDAGSLRHTTVPDDQIRWPEKATFCFERTYKDLEIISVGKESFSDGFVFDEKEPGKNVRDGPLFESKPGMEASEDQPGWIKDMSSCPACRGRLHRGHSYSGQGERRCQWSGLDKTKMKTLRKDSAKLTDSELRLQLMREVSEDVVTEGQNWVDAHRRFKEKVKAAMDSQNAAMICELINERRTNNEEVVDDGVAQIFTCLDGECVEWKKIDAKDVIGTKLEYHDHSTDESTNYGGSQKEITSDSDSGDEDSIRKGFEADVRFNKRGDPVMKGAQVDAISKELGKQMLTETDRAAVINNKPHLRGDAINQKTVSDQRDYFVFENGSADAEPNDACIFVTRFMSKTERESQEGLKATRGEMQKVYDKGTFGKPMLIKDATAQFPDAAVCGLLMLAHIKNVQDQNPDKHKYKGRVVVLGNRIWNLKDGTVTFMNGKDEGLYGDVASLAAFRAVASHATRKNYVLESADVANAYLNAPWPKDQRKQFLKFSQNEYKLLPDVYKAEIDKLGGPDKVLVPMDYCLYGHPLSGFIWIAQLHQWLLDEGFELVPGVKSLYQKKDVLICVYVDDLAVAGPRDQVDALWNKLDKSRSSGNVSGTYDLREVGPCEEFLGIKVIQRKHPKGWGNIIELSMYDYIMNIVKVYEKEFSEYLEDEIAEEHEYVPVAPKRSKGRQKTKKQDDSAGKTSFQQDPCDTDETTDEEAYVRKTSVRKGAVRTRLIPMTPEQQDGTQEQHKWDSTVPKKRAQKLIGMLLWACRCTRADVAYATSRLASAIARWYDIHEELARQIVGYLKRTAHQKLQFNPADPSLPIILELHTDASWHQPRSQSGHVLVRIQYSADGETSKVLALIDWSSNKQSLSADSSASSELIAAHGGLRASLPIAIGLQYSAGHGSEQIPIRMRIDNQAICQIAKTGVTKGLIWMETKPICIRAGCIHDLVELGAFTVLYVKTNEQLADLHTKALCKIKLEDILEKIGIVDGRPSFESTVRIILLAPECTEDAGNGRCMNMGGE